MNTAAIERPDAAPPVTTATTQTPMGTGQGAKVRAGVDMTVLEKVGELLGLGPEPNLPTRVRELVDAQERRAEQLICWAQFFLAVGLGVFYGLAPKPADADAGMAMLSPVPTAVAGYLLFNLMRLAVVYRATSPTWLVYLSIIVDVGALLGVIAFFHIQYGQPASFSLQVPTFIALFIFIALRALRFDPRFVLAAGLIASVGWAGLLWYALEATGERSAPITRNFIEYINGTPILIGAEVEKIFMLLTMTAVLAIAIARARRMFLTAMRDRSASQQMGRFLSQGLAEKIADADETFRAGEAAERNAAVLMLDIRGFTPFAVQHGPQRLVEMLTRFHQLSVPIIERHGGVIDKFLGDGVMATFGAIGPSETAARDAIAAMRDVLDDAERWLAQEGFGDLLDANAAVSAGPLVFTTLGHGERLEYTVIGPPVNLAAKLEKHNKVLSTRGLVDMTTFLAALEQGLEGGHAFNPAREAMVAGVTDPLELMSYGRSTREVIIPAHERAGTL